MREESREIGSFLLPKNRKEGIGWLDGSTGITVEIGGDTTKLQTALKGVNTEIRNTQSQLRDVDKLLKLDSGNTELLAQKHRLLGDAVKETKEKLETLKTAAEQAEQALKDGTITQEQYDGLQREIAETEAKLKSLEEQARQSGTALQEIAAKGEKLKTVGDIVTPVYIGGDMIDEIVVTAQQRMNLRSGGR